jgi:hypothetical protein
MQNLRRAINARARAHAFFFYFFNKIFFMTIRNKKDLILAGRNPMILLDIFLSLPKPSEGFLSLPKA